MTAFNLWHSLRDYPWDEAEVPRPPAPRPEPEVRARSATAEETPAAAQRLYDAALIHGWYGTVTYARGPMLHSSQGTVTRTVDSVAVRLANQGAEGMQRAVAVWVDGGFDTAWLWVAGQWPRFEVGSDALRAHVAGSRDATLSVERKGRCPGCGKPAGRSRTFTAADLGDQTETWKAAAAQAAAWQPELRDELFRHEKC